VKIWRLPAEVVDSGDHDTILEFNSRYFEKPEQFISQTNEIYDSSPPETYDLLELSDGRVLERFSRIQFVD
jgi:hypothetical protein